MELNRDRENHPPSFTSAQPNCASRDDLAPSFCAEALVHGKVKEVCLEDYKGQWLVLFFYSSDFTFV
ncbi:MAG: hypothetical protein A2201_02700 [Alicyclobacillus sp. RIFOXYA1_FULL_53_8]|nr:MAG: hypothetical protein A2201_02700 [Alicyclobacillus sp. RIFOXYA1_FULL_53_8]